MPASLRGDFLLAEGTAAVLRLPEGKESGFEANIVGPLSFLAEFKVSEPVWVVRIGEIANFDVAFNGNGRGMKELDAVPLPVIIHFVVAEVELVARVEQRLALGRPTVKEEVTAENENGQNDSSYLLQLVDTLDIDRLEQSQREVVAALRNGILALAV